MFIGEYTHSIDDKGRVAIPAKFRAKLGAVAIVTRGLDRCLFVFAKPEWDKLAEKIIALPLAKADSRAFARLMLSGAVDVTPDTQGRVVIPENLKRYAGLEKTAVVAGVYNRIEIWDETTWQRYKEKTEAASDDIAEKLGEMGI